MGPRSEDSVSAWQVELPAVRPDMHRVARLRMFHSHTAVELKHGKEHTAIRVRAPEMPSSSKHISTDLRSYNTMSYCVHFKKTFSAGKIKPRD